MLTRKETQWMVERDQQIQDYLKQEKRKGFIDDQLITETLEETKNSPKEKVKEIIQKAKDLKGLTPNEVATLLNVEDPQVWEEIFELAIYIKREIYGNRIVLFAPLYISSPCVNDCLYCGFRQSNHDVEKKTLTMKELEEEINVLTSCGHKRLIVVYGEHPHSDIDFICKTIKKIYEFHNGNGQIRRVNINAAPFFIEEYKKLKEIGIGTYQVFQETYHHKTYQTIHPKGTLKHYYRWRLFALHRAQMAGIDDVAIGALFGLYDWRFEVIGLILHAQDMDKEFGVGSHTISFPRLEPALGTPFTINSPYKVNNEDFKKIVATLRLAVPYTGLILTARENPRVHRETIKLGVSQTDAGSRIAVGGYTQIQKEHILEKQQFRLGDTRSLDEFIYELLEDDYIPSFCTAGYRCGRTGCQFMDYAKKGLVKNFCIPNAILTFKEYLIDYAHPRTKELGKKVIENYLMEFQNNFPQRAELLKKYIKRIENGERDIYI